MPLPKLITRDHLEEGMDLANQHCSHADAGLFGPGSLLWQLCRENLLTLAQGRTLLLALSHSRFASLLSSEHDAVQRLQHTQVMLFRLIFGNLEQVLITLRNLRERQRTLLCVNESHSLLFIISAWSDSALTVYQDVIEPLSSAHQERLFEEAMLLARILGIPEQHLPRNWHCWRHWWQAQLHHPRHPTPRVRRLGQQLVRLRGYPGRAPYGSYLPLAGFQLPQQYQQYFQLPDANLDALRHYQQQLDRLMRLTRALPQQLRLAPAYREALQRLEGRPRADLTTRLLNRWWTGKSDLVNSGWSLPREARLPYYSG